MQSALDPASPQARRVDALWRAMLAASAVVVFLVIGAMLLAVFRRNRTEPHTPLPAEREVSDRKLARAVGAAAAATIAILFGFLVMDFTTGRSLSAVPPGAIVIEVIGHQFWWEIHYQDTLPSRQALTANEIHVPIGQPVVLELTSRDVIHSFWAPNLNGKRDLIPGYTTSVWFQADTPGVYRGQCAEFCGHQHANMALFVIAESRTRYDQWLAHELQPAAPPADSLTRRGERVFLGGTCPLCHAIGGTDAGGRVAPDLTHLAGRRTIAAGTLPNTRGNLAGWIVDPQAIKPGSHMPSSALTGEDLQALLAYLESLQ